MSDNEHVPTPQSPAPALPPYAAQPPYAQAAPVAYAQPYAVGYPYGTPPTPAARQAGAPALGLVALLLALAATVVCSIVAAIATAQAAPAFVTMIDSVYPGDDPDLSYLSPVRGWVLAAEIAFWVGTALGIWAFIQGWIATVQRRGRGQGIAAIVISALGPFIFGAVALIGFLYAAGMSLQNA